MLSLTFDTSSLFLLAFYISALVFVIHAIIVCYHWLSFGADKKISMLSVLIFLGGGAGILLTLVILLSFI